MKDINSYLEKFRKIKSPRTDKETISRIIKTITTFDLDPKEISFQKNTLFIKTNPYLRTAILAQKEVILEHIKREQISVMVYDIK